MSYTVSGNVVSTVKGDDVVTITATFDESIADTSVMRISGIGVEEVTGEEMTRVNESTYTYEWTVNPGVGGQQTWAMSSGADLAGNEVASSPSAGGSISQDPSPVAPAGSGAESDPYLIATVDNLNWLSQSSGEWGVGK